MAQANSTSNLRSFPPVDPEIDRRHKLDIPPVFHRASPSERMELLRWIAEIDSELMKQHVEEYHQGGGR